MRNGVSPEFRGFDGKIFSMYSLGLTARQIQDHLKEIYAVGVPPELISRVTDEVKERIQHGNRKGIEIKKFDGTTDSMEYGELFLRFLKRDGFLVTRPSGKHGDPQNQGRRQWKLVAAAGRCLKGADGAFRIVFTTLADQGGGSGIDRNGARRAE
jgi:hypothetical protein